MGLWAPIRGRHAALGHYGMWQGSGAALSLYPLGCPTLHPMVAVSLPVHLAYGGATHFTDELTEGLLEFLQ